MHRHLAQNTFLSYCICLCHLLTLPLAFKLLESSSQQWLQGLVYLIGNLLGSALAIYKCQSMGLLPTHSSDWLAFIEPPQVSFFQFSLVLLYEEAYYKGKHFFFLPPPEDGDNGWRYGLVKKNLAIAYTAYDSWSSWRSNSETAVFLYLIASSVPRFPAAQFFPIKIFTVKNQVLVMTLFSAVGLSLSWVIPCLTHKASRIGSDPLDPV